ncbi:RnfH family protein [Psychromonas sp. Urea-02u-13]|uniref:RnfH family protein n=1 Tax=Psychromonas sp. Urea-02u-13 TaxID=2058326 RepID=UPI000C33CFE6|nr:RnfH family protein [Psychromonas sp. Urea-02u-13]PKG37097.1 RnfH family protein [Psychromonas sp. Urea-02u-13]
MSDMIEIEVVYGLPHKQVLLSLPVPAGSCIEECIKLSGIITHFPEIVPHQAKVGIFSRPEKLETIIKAGDRIEIYRPLTADPKEMRKLRAAKMSKK